ncbi:MAG: TIR domain-containing protein [Actinophytocola sp.]|uniref:TIR domain-containing protein n=1 Tax=Actinophytocola sp. TaxID=1872138 RepID=UPI003C7484DD
MTRWFKPEAHRKATPRMGSIFINYRRTEAYAAALLDEKISPFFGATNVFRAGRSILAGADYEVAINQAITQCRVLLAIVGPGWSQKFGSHTDNKPDWTIREIEGALERDIPIIPLLLSGVGAISEHDIPVNIARVARAQYLRFDYRNVEQDARKIADELTRTVPALAARRFTRFSRVRLHVSRPH